MTHTLGYFILSFAPYVFAAVCCEILHQISSSFTLSAAAGVAAAGAAGAGAALISSSFSFR